MLAEFVKLAHPGAQRLSSEAGGNKNCRMQTETQTRASQGREVGRGRLARWANHVSPWKSPCQEKKVLSSPWNDKIGDK